MKKKTLAALLLVPAILLTGCSDLSSNASTDSTDSNDTGQSGSSSGSSLDGSSKSTASADTSGLFSDRDYEMEYDESKSTAIQLNKDTVECSSAAVQITGGTVTITDEGTYILSGTLDDGMIIINTEKTDKIQIVLNGVTIHSETSAPVYVQQADKVFVTTAAGTENTLSNGGTFTAIDENSIDAVIFSKDDVTLNGSGSLTVTSPSGHGIVSKDSLKITGGSYEINCASHALNGKDDVCIADGNFTIISGKDGIHAENADDTAAGFVYIQNGTYNISAGGDGISAAAYMLIEDGAFDITTGGGSSNASSKTSDSWGNFMEGGRPQSGGKMEHPGDAPDGNPPDGNVNVPDGNAPTQNAPAGNEPPAGTTDTTAEPASDTSADSSADTTSDTDSTSIKGIKAAADLTVNNGTFVLNSADDSFHSNTSVTVNGGTFDITSGDDAFHADETLTFTAGTVNITESYEGLEGLHIDISGGDITLIAKDDGLNAAGGTDSSGTTGGRDGMFGQKMSSSSNGSITISGGTVNITASGDGIDANGSIDITGGYTTVCGPNQGDTSTLDYDSSASISGGTFIGTGASGMAQSFSDSGQGVITVNVGTQSEGTEIKIADSEGTLNITYSPDLSFSVVIFSSPDIVTGETYTITAGSVSEEYTAG